MMHRHTIEGIAKSDRARVLVTMAISACLAAGSNLLLRHAMAAVSARGGGSLILAAVIDPSVLAGLAGYGTSHLLWLHVLSRARLGAMFPLFVSATFVMVMAGSVLILGEQVTAQRLGGAALVCLGIAVAEWSRAASGIERGAS
jgi:drug/metabolite transporter (DMT)-like permease